MPKFYTLTTNSTFRSTDEGAEYKDVDEAYRAGLQAAVGIVGGELGEGSPTSTVELMIVDHEGKAVRRSAVTLAVANLLLPS